MSHLSVKNAIGKYPISWGVRGKLDKLVNGLLNPSPLEEAPAGESL
jgi:hypothetical protein